ncbi:phage tail tape measure protein [Corynebacterium callunae]|uniref:phage tail tape measure protein n=1 Tax=Corynebacterium callunae TaxID=1721 RepID=UPI001FFF26D6|nr:phage tail tape measure protein [Corynebacterium callunae]MCK2199200.1 phage tail tape measure protein [Corynebacterium callunae]
MAGGKIDILVSPDVSKFPGELESGLKGTLGSAAKIGSAIGLALGGAATVKSVAEIGIEFDKQMNSMAAVSQASADQLAAVEAKARELGKSTDLTATSASDATAAMTELVKGGFSVQESMDAAKGTLQLAAAAQIDAASAATIQSQALQAFGLDASYAATASDVLAGAANASSAEIEGIALGLQQSGAVANQFGVSLEDNATALAMFANAGIQGSDAGTLLKSALLALTDQGKPAQSAIEELGLTVYDAQGKFVGLETLFGQLDKAAASMTDEQYQAATATLFGSDAMRLAGIAAEQGAEGFRQTEVAVTRAGQASEVAAAQAQGLPGILEMLQNQAEDTGLALYDAFSGIAVTGGTKLIGVLENVGPKIESAAQGIAGGINAALPTIERVTGVVAGGVEDIASGLGVLGGISASVFGGLADLMQPAASGALGLSENLDGLAGPLIAASAALAVGKWRGWGESVDGAASKFTGFAKDVNKNQDFFRSMGRDVSSLTATWVTLEEKIPTIGRMGDAYRNAAEPMQLFATRQRELSKTAQETSLQARSLFESIDLIGQSVGRSATAKVADFAGTLRGSLSAGLEGAKGAASGLVSALGGGWNVAIAGATMAATVITSEIAKTKRSQELLKELGNQAETTGDALYKSMSQGDLGAQIEALDNSLQGLIDKQKELADTAPGVGGTITAMLKDYAADVNPFDNGRTSEDVYNEFKAQDSAAESAKRFSEAIKQAGIDAETAGTAVGGTQSQYDALIESLDLTTDGGRAAADAFAEQRNAYLEMQELTSSLAPGSVALSEALAKIGDEASSSEERVSALNEALNNMLGIDPTADEAIANLHEEIDQVTESAVQALDQTQGWGDSLFNEAGGLNLAQANARTFRDSLMGMRDSLLDVAATGGDVNGAFEAQQPALDALAQQYGISGERVRELATEMGLVPTLIESTVAVSTDAALIGLGEVFGAIQKNQLEVGKPLSIDVENVDESQKKLEDLGLSVEVLHEDADGRGAIKVIADTQQAIDDIDTLVTAISSLDPEKGITFHSNSPEQIEQIRELGVEITDLGDGEYVITSNSPEEIARLVEIGALVKDEKTGQVTVNSNLDEVLRKGQSLDARDGRKTTETHTVNQVTNRIEYFQRLNPGMSAADASRIQGPFAVSNAQGSVRAAANGWLSQQDAQIARGGSWLVWAEDETKGESFIPHAPEKRGRSTQILAETASIFGLGLVDRGGNQVTRDGSSVAPKSTSYFADGAVRTADEILAFADGNNIDGYQAARSLEGANYVYGGINWGDCSAAVAGLARFAVDVAPFAARFATMNEREALSALGFSSGLGGSGDFNIGWFNGGPWGGHTSATIGGVNVEMGGARGNGQIGGGAAPANHSQYTDFAHIALPGSSGITSEDLEVTSTSVNGYSYKSRGVQEKNVDWGDAASLYADARRHLGVYDTGGILPAGGVAVNRSSMDEVIVNGPDLKAINNLSSNVGALVQELRSGDTGAAQSRVQAINADLINEMASAVESAEDQVVSFGRTLGGDWVGKAKIVQDAERGLAETRMGLSEESAALAAQEKEVARARENLAKVSSAGGELSTSTARKVADAEEDLAQAREGGKAEKIADAEKKLSRAREDAAADLEKSQEQSAKETLSAMEDVQQAEADLAEMRNLQATAALRLEAAERAVAAARYQAIADLAESLGGSLASVANNMSALFGTLAQQAQIMEETRQRLIGEQIERQAADLAAQRARLDLVVAEQDIARARVYGAISVADAEAALADARDQAAVKGATGIDAMSQALDRARETGIFSVEDVAQSVIDNAEEVRAAQYAVEAAKAQAALDELEATYRQRGAVLDLAQATLTQQKAIALVDISTQQLADQAAKLGGLTSQGAQQASNGWGGLGKLFGGIGQVVGGLAGVATSLATGNIAGAISSGVGAVQGVGNVFTGGREAWNNRGEIVDSWRGMSLGDKLTVGGGLLLGGGVAAAGSLASGYLGIDVTAAAGAIGAEIANQAVSYAGSAITSDLTKINLKADEARDKALLEAQIAQAKIDAKRATLDMEYLQQSTVLSSNVEIAELLGKIAEADTTAQADALAEAAIVAAERRDQMLDIMSRQLDIAESQEGKPRQTINIPLPEDGWIPTSTVESLIDTMNRVQTEVEIKKNTVSGADYIAART